MAVKTLPTTDPNYPRFVQIGVQLTEHRRAMRTLKKERDALLGKPVAATRPSAARGAAKIAAAANEAGVITQGAPAAQGESFAAVPAGAPRGRRSTDQATGQADAAISVYAQVRTFFEKNPGIVHTASTLATALGLGTALQRPVGEAIKKLAKEKVVREMTRGKWAHVEMAGAAATT